MSDKLLKWLKAVVFVCVAMMLIHQLYKSFYSPFTTETVMSADLYDGVDVVGFVIKDETVIHSDKTGVIGYPIKEGGRVAKNGTVANLFQSEEAANAYITVEALTKEIETLKDTQTYNDLYAADLGLVNKKINESLIQFLTDRQRTKKSIAYSSDSELANFINRKQIITGQATDYNTLIASLEQKKASYQVIFGGNVGSIKTDISGYFISVVDGYESVIGTDQIASLTAETLKNLKPETVPPTAICKVVADYKWYIAAEIPFDYSLSLKEGQSMTLKTAIDGYTKLPVTIETVNRNKADENAVVVFSCKIVSEELAGLRTLPATILTEHYSGLRVNKASIRVEEGKTGVYVFKNNQLEFVEVEVLYTDKYSIVKQEMGKEDSLRLYDEIVVRGRDLYDGMVIR